MTENEKWNLFIGRKVLVIMPGAKSVQTAIVTGCDPDIGICLNDPGVIEPHTIMLGPLAPGYHVEGESDDHRKDYLRKVFAMIQSGYYSVDTWDQIYQECYGER